MLLLVHLTSAGVRLLEVVALILTVLVLIVLISIFLLILIVLPILVPTALVSSLVSWLRILIWRIALWNRLRLLIFWSVIVVWLIWLELAKVLLRLGSKSLRFRLKSIWISFRREWLWFWSERGLIDLHGCWLGLRTGRAFFFWLEWLCIFRNKRLRWRSESSGGYLHCRCCIICISLRGIRIIDLLLYIRALGVGNLLVASAFVNTCHTLSLWCRWVRLTTWFITDLILLWLLFLFLLQILPTHMVQQTLKRRFFYFFIFKTFGLLIETLEFFGVFKYCCIVPDNSRVLYFFVLLLSIPQLTTLFGQVDIATCIPLQNFFFHLLGMVYLSSWQFWCVDWSVSVICFIVSGLFSGKLIVITVISPH